MKNTKMEGLNNCHAELGSASLAFEIPSSADRLAQKFEILKLIQNDKFLARFVKQVRNDKSRAFTLAEVLITLTIIGVIAAITMPNLIQSYRKHQVETGIKAAYSIISNALNMAKTQSVGCNFLHRNTASRLYKTDIANN